MSAQMVSQLSPLDRYRKSIADKASSGLSPGRASSPRVISRAISPMELDGCTDSVKLEPEDSNTFNSWSPSPRKLLWPRSPEYFPEVTENCLDPQLLMPMSQRAIPQSPTPSSVSDASLSSETQSQTGSQSGSLPPLAPTSKSQLQYAFFLTAPYVVLEQITPSLLLLAVQPLSTRASLEVVSPIKHGNRQEGQLSLRTHGRSGGLVTKVKSMLSSMNFEVLSRSTTYYDGSIHIRVMWRLKAHVYHYLQHGSGLLQTYTHESGIPTWTQLHLMP